MEEYLQALHNLGEPVEQWDSWLVYYCKKKLDADTRFEWEKKTANEPYPTFKQMQKFLFDHSYALEASEEKSKKTNCTQRMNASSSTTPTKCFNVVQKNNCFMCNGDHRLPYCPDYTRLDVQERKSKVLGLKLCLNCFSRQHFVSQCPKPASCGICKRKHHPTLHIDEQFKRSVQVSGAPKNDSGRTPNVSTFVEQSSVLNKEVLLATALVHARSFYGQKILCRVLLDPGSQSSFVTRGFTQRLRLKKLLLNNGISVNGIGDIAKGTLSQVVRLNLSSVHSDDTSVMVNALVIDQITSNVPRHSILELDWPELDSLQLADEHFLTSGPVDILLGADVYPNLILEGMGVRKSCNSETLAQQTVFGWIITGSTKVKAEPSFDQPEPQGSTLSNFVETDNLLKKFWEIEENSSVKCWSLEEKNCESHFKETTYREDNGRYVVSLPFKGNYSLGESYPQALERLEQTEKRLARDPKLKENYAAVMKEYFDLNHAEKVPEEEVNDSDVYYMPHHGVVRESSSTTKLRVVFDASAKTSIGSSLNDCLIVGPKVQEDLVNILIRFRLHPASFSADIAKMYRQVILHPHDRNFHRFLWRESPIQDVQEYR